MIGPCRGIGMLVVHVKSKRSAFAFVVIALAIVGTPGCQPVPPYSTLAPVTDFGAAIQDIYLLLIWLGGAVLIGVQVALIYALLRYRRRPGHGIPRQVHGSTPLEVAWTIVPALILVVIAVPTIQTIFRTQPSEPAAAAEVLPVTVIGHQWWWEVRYPTLGIVTANDIHLPLNRPVQITLESADVIHSFWVPRFGGKRDVIPNKTNHLVFTPTEPGVFLGECAEFCGLQHARMGFRAIVDSPEGFDAWVSQFQQPAPTGPSLPSDLARQGEQVFADRGCGGCHTIAGTPHRGAIGPNLTRFGNRLTIASGTLENTPENLARWLRNPQEVKVGNQMPNLRLTEQEIDALVAYLHSLR